MNRIPTSKIYAAIDHDIRQFNLSWSEDFLSGLQKESPANSQALKEYLTTKNSKRKMNPNSLGNILRVYKELGIPVEESKLNLIQEKIIKQQPKSQKSLYEVTFEPLKQAQKETPRYVKHLIPDNGSTKFVVITNDAAGQWLSVDLCLELSDDEIKFKFGFKTREIIFEDNPLINKNFYAPYEGFCLVNDEYINLIGCTTEPNLREYAPLFMMISSKSVRTDSPFFGVMHSTYDRNRLTYSSRIIVLRVQQFEGIPLGIQEVDDKARPIREWLSGRIGDFNISAEPDPSGLSSFLDRFTNF